MARELQAQGHPADALACAMFANAQADALSALKEAATPRFTWARAYGAGIRADLNKEPRVPPPDFDDDAVAELRFVHVEPDHNNAIAALERVHALLDAPTAPDPTMTDDPWPLLTKLRDTGWSVAIHNDYWQNGIRYSFWLFTDKHTGRYVKGEGHTDSEALTQALALAERG